MNQPLSRADILNQLLPGLEELFGMEYEKLITTEYVKRCRYGKYSIYRWDYTGVHRTSSTTVAKGLSKEEADGFMKLLKEFE